MIAVALVSETVLDRVTFMSSTKSVTGENHVSVADLFPTLTRLSDDIVILKDFAGKQVDLSTAITYIGFLVAGMDHDIEEVIEYTRGMPHLHTNKVDLRRGHRCVLICGSLDQWKEAVLQGCKSHELSIARECFNKIYDLMKQKGLGKLFDESIQREHTDGTFLLENK